MRKATSKKVEQKEHWNSTEHKNWMLAQVENEKYVQVCQLVVVCSNHEVLFIFFLQAIDHTDIRHHHC